MSNLVDGSPYIQGATDDTLVGNIGDRLKTTTVITASSVSAFSSKLRYDDMNVSTGGVARGSTVTDAAWTTVYSYTGSGVITGIGMNLQTANSDWLLRLLVDGTNEITGSGGILTSDIDSVYGMTVGPQNIVGIGIGLGVDTGHLYLSIPISSSLTYTSSVSILLRRATAAQSKLFYGGIIVLTKET